MIWVAVVAVATIAAWIAYDGGWMAFVWRHRRGRFDIVRNDAHAFKFRTDFGAFTIDRQARLLRTSGAVDIDGIPLEWIDHIRFEYRTTTAHELANGFDVWDCFERYRDVIQWYRVSLVSVEAPSTIPLFEVGQYEPKEPLMSGVFESEAAILAKAGLFRDVHERAHEVMEEILSAFECAGHPISTTPKWVRTLRQKAGETSGSGASAPPSLSA